METGSIVLKTVKKELKMGPWIQLGLVGIKKRKEKKNPNRLLPLES